ncbi:serine/threonine-protein kinase SMG1-like [Hibiscus syriacus]|uniref:serine/threonine-protein kinase SMG1-like n=1 Tax=Hibiscus syriacus TaxID=106335 RepID=UPI0019219556|nr:serine/threonine-protein kinase SMG1-like [Hibiscus syriacus]
MMKSHIVDQKMSTNVEVENADEVKLATDETNEHLKAVPSVSDESVSNPLESSQPSNRVNLDVKFQSKDEVSTLGKVEVDDESHEVPVPSTDRASRLARGKNSYAMSVLRRVEMKLDGRDITDRRKLSIAEQVDYLLKQATSVDNLCSVYEGWTPWI